MIGPIELISIFGASLICALLAFGIFQYVMARPQPSSAAEPDPVSFLFDDGVLHHATQNALTSYALFPGAHVWDDLRESLLSRFPQFPETARSEAIGSMTLLPNRQDDPGLLKLHWRGAFCWVEVLNRSDNASHTPLGPAQMQALSDAAETSPHPAWETLPNGQIGWCNPAYTALAKEQGLKPDVPLFQPADDAGSYRVQIASRSGTTEWFEVHSHRLGHRMIHHATSVTPLLQAEDAQRTFMQTLAKTFAELPLGLAIFDRNAQLSIFNPALVDLSGLQAQYLASQPTMLSFFDAMRENRCMPEPKNYNTWRKEISAMIAAATDGRYHETWTLEDGRTYTVQGRPHLDGATAFVIEDISAEITLTRNFRAEVEQYEALLNSVEDAMVVFSSGGVVTFCNEAYRRLWGQNPEAAFADVTVQDAVAIWERQAEGDWSDISDYIKTHGSQKPLAVDVSLRNSGAAKAHLLQLNSEATLVRFSVAEAPHEHAQALNG